MTKKMFSCFYVSVCVFLITLSGCGSRQSYDKKFYIFNSIRNVESNTAKTDCVLEVRNFTIDSAFSSKGLVYRIDELEYESDFYNEFLVSPSAMITEKTRTWLSDAGFCKRVLDPGSQVDPTHLIEGNITELYGDFRDKSSPTAVIEMRIFLLKVNPGKDPSLVFGETYKSSIGVSSKSPEGLVNALSKCLEEILVNFKQDLVGNLS